jgi:hypothetical protein
LSELSLAKIWNKIGVLVSLAPVESYGRVMREGLLSGVPVWVSKSSGALDLIAMSSSKGVKLLDLNSSDKTLLRDFESLIRVKPDYNFRNKILIENKTLADLLVNSWLELVVN